MRRSTSRLSLLLAGAIFGLVVSACSSEGLPPPPEGQNVGAGVDVAEMASPAITLAFAGDVHFEGAFAQVPRGGRSTLGPMSDALREADLAIVNLETALTTRGSPARKELEDPADRYWFRAPPSTLDVLDRSGVDAVSMANNHAGDFGKVGIRDALEAGERSPVEIIGVGLHETQAYRPLRRTIGDTEVAVFAADATPRESADPIWAVAPGTGPGIASARARDATRLVDAVRRSASAGELTVVYLHWGTEYVGCPTDYQQNLVRSLAEAGADVVVGTHAHVPLGAGMLDTTYVSFGLGNFFWYHGGQSETGVLRLTVREDEVVTNEYLPGRLRPRGGNPQPLTGKARSRALMEWRALRDCTDLAPPRGTTPPTVPAPDVTQDDAAALPPFTSRVAQLGAVQQRRIRRQEPAGCPVGVADLRQLRLAYVGFDGRAHLGRLVVHRDVASDVVDVFTRLYEARFPIRRMRPVDRYGSNDNRSMAANNTSGYNCRRVAGQARWSDHAYGRAIDINPVQNPYLLGSDVLPPAGRQYVNADRTPGPRKQRGVIRDDNVVVRAFRRLGWAWGGEYSEADYQHFSAPEKG